MSFIPFQALLTRWFSHRLGLAVAISSCGFNIGGIIFVPLVTLLVDSLGWRHAYFISGVLIMITLVPLALLIVRNRPSDKQMSVEEAAFSTIGPAGKAARPRRNLAANWRLRDILRTRSFWLLAVTFSIFFIGPISFMLHAVPFFESRDLSRSTAAAIISYQALVALGARVFFGLMADRISEARLLGVGTALLSAAALAVLLAPLSPFVLVIFVLLWGIAAGAGPLLETLILSRAFGVGAFGSLLGMLMAVETVGMIAGPYFGGYIFDASGSYTLAFLIYIAGFIVAACGFALFRSPAPRLAPAPSEASAVA
jgi:predicted MFS family arabinose efflux permease